MEREGRGYTTTRCYLQCSLPAHSTVGYTTLPFSSGLCLVLECPCQTVYNHCCNLQLVQNFSLQQLAYLTHQSLDAVIKRFSSQERISAIMDCVFRQIYLFIPLKNRSTHTFILKNGIINHCQVRQIFFVMELIKKPFQDVLIC